MKDMRFSQFSLQYYPLTKKDRKAYRMAEANTNNERKIGYASNAHVLGVENVYAPITMKLTNNIIMKKRQSNNCVLRLQHTNLLDNFASNILFGKWNVLEDATSEPPDQTEINNRREIQMALWEMSIFPEF